MPFSRTGKVWKREVVRMAMEKFWIFLWESLKYLKMGITYRRI